MTACNLVIASAATQSRSSAHALDCRGARRAPRNDELPVTGTLSLAREIFNEHRR